MAIEIEPGGESGGLCADCGNETRTVWGYASEDGAAKAAYFIQWTAAHSERRASFILSIGGWGGGNIEDRRAVALACRMEAGEDRPGFMIVDAQTRDPMQGTPQTRAQVIGTPLAAEAFAIVDAIFEGDTRFRVFLAGTTG